jgi:ferredoxin
MSAKRTKPAYHERRLLRRAEGLWARGERLLGRLTDSPLNPLYHLGTLSIFLLIVLTLTGIYLGIFYRPSAERAYATVAGIDAFWLGSLVRTIHRYAADGLIITVVLHALKMFLGDRFWGSRWLSWVSGWMMLALIWVIGVMGYWLVWDQRAQWLTEYALGAIGGPAALTFITAEALAQASTFFIIILFLHAFLPIAIGLGLLFHLMRLARPRLWAPRLIMIEAVIALLILAIWRPATSAPPADPSRLVGTITLDGWYLGFLALAAQWGSALFWGAAGLLFLMLVALPWLARGRNQGPALVIEEACTGCGVCVQECPYGALEMRPLPSGARYPAIAVVNPSLCTGCGLCVGACATEGIELTGLRSATVREQLRRTLREAPGGDRAPVVIFACRGHDALGTLLVRNLASATGQIEPTPAPSSAQPASASAGGSGPLALTIPLVDASAQHGRIALGYWSGAKEAKALPVVTCALPCVGMVQPEMIRDSLGAGASAAVVLIGPDHECGFREGPRWLTERLDRRQSLVRQGVYVVEAPPGDQRALTALLERFAGDRAAEPAGLPGLRGQTIKGQRLGISFAAGLAALTLALSLSLVLELPATAGPTDQGRLRVALRHTAQVKASAAGLSPDMQSKLPEGVSVEQLVGGERFPVRIRLEIDGAIVAEREYQPGGLRREGAATGLETWPLIPGRHQVRLWMMDDGSTWREAFAGPIDLAQGSVATLIYDTGEDRFVMR